MAAAAGAHSKPGTRRTLRPRRRGAQARQRTPALEIALLTSPAIILFVGLVIFPIVLAAYYSFYKWQGYGPPTDWVGLGNYKIIFTDPAFQQAIEHNGLIVGCPSSSRGRWRSASRCC